MSLYNDNGNYTQAVIDDGSIFEGEMKWSEWEAKYKLVPNHFMQAKYPDHQPEYQFETYDEELEYINSLDPHYVWTWVQGDMCDLIIAGKAYVNRLAYYVTEVPWEDGNEQILVSVEVECECYDEDKFDYGGDPDCDICEGNGLRTEYVD